MEDALNIAGSGLLAAGAIAATAAQNLVNLDTPGYHAREVEVAPLADGGVRIVEVVVDPRGPPRGQSDVDPVAQAIEIQKAQTLYTADAELINASQQMYGSLIDMLDTQLVAPLPHVP